MASLICWASGLLEVVPTKEVPVDSGPVVLRTGMSSKLYSLKLAHGEYREEFRAWYVPGTKPIPKDDADKAGAQQRENMTLVIAFSKKINGS